MYLENMAYIVFGTMHIQLGVSRQISSVNKTIELLQFDATALLLLKQPLF
jgi:hypothetical protein